MLTKRRFKNNATYGDRRRRDIVRILETLAGKGLIHFAGLCPLKVTQAEAKEAQKVTTEDSTHELAEVVALEIPSRKLAKTQDLSPPPTEPANFGSQT